MRPARGFTLIELMVVVTIVGIVLTIGLPAFGNYRASMDLKRARAQLNADIRNARQLAITRRAPVYIKFGSPPTTTNITTYTIHIDSNADGVMNNNERVLNRTMPTNTIILSTAMTPNVDSLVFDISGILWPGTSGGTLVFQNKKNARDTLAVSAAGIIYRP